MIFLRMRGAPSNIDTFDYKPQHLTTQGQRAQIDLLGLDHERLTYHYTGREMRLTELAGRVVREIVA